MKSQYIPQRKSLFWDTDPSQLEVNTHAHYIIERILDLGNDTEVKWLFQQYTPKVIKKVLYTPRVQLHKKSKNFWELMLGKPNEA